MKTVQITQLSWEELQKKFESIELQLKLIQRNFQPKVPKKYVTRQFVAKEMLHCDLSTVHNLTVKGILTKYQIGGRVLYIRQEVENAIVELKK